VVVVVVVVVEITAVPCVITQKSVVYTPYFSILRMYIACTEDVQPDGQGAQLVNTVSFPDRALGRCSK
jgi:hypothetical protein